MHRYDFLALLMTQTQAQSLSWKYICVFFADCSSSFGRETLLPSSMDQDLSKEIKLRFKIPYRQSLGP